MAVMTTGQRRDCWQELMSEWSRERKSIPITKDVLQECVNAVDQWFSDQHSSLRSAMPAKVTSSMTEDRLDDIVMSVYRFRRGGKTR